MAHDLTILAITAASIGFLHTLLGPDHYLPFVVLARARRWSLARTSLITLLCGIGHVGSSVVLGLLGIGLGLAVSRLKAFEAWRGNVAAWLLIAVGVLYGAWGLHRALRGKEHAHLHLHLGGAGHGHHHGETHAHSDGGAGHHHHDAARAHTDGGAGSHHQGEPHAQLEGGAGSGSGGASDRTADHPGAPMTADLRDEAHLRAHADQVAARPSATPWVLFIVFVLGPCEPLIPLLMYPAATRSTAGLVLVTAVFAAATLATMLTVVTLATLGVNLLPMGRLERYSHALAGAAIALSGLGIELMGL